MPEGRGGARRAGGRAAVEGAINGSIAEAQAGGPARSGNQSRKQLLQTLAKWDPEFDVEFGQSLMSAINEAERCRLRREPMIAVYHKHASTRAPAVRQQENCERTMDTTHRRPNYDPPLHIGNHFAAIAETGGGPKIWVGAGSTATCARRGGTRNRCREAVTRATLRRIGRLDHELSTIGWLNG
ncbi:hypothetical protein B0H17DRAFT_1138904 [Mycena rosella]|uniref:Uncharacterized protein n=1 Tax=Mycena rosella TaxID=1033263 RepID=A0AAD7D5B6_MYCRO|nr:hypothetical protein B0H17DRAFT_1138904 [Mycena rosella]